ncbi:hypothetical protein [Sphingomonas oryzagri]
MAKLSAQPALAGISAADFVPVIRQQPDGSFANGLIQAAPALHPGTGWKWGLAGDDRSFLGLVASDDVFAPERFRAPAGAITRPMLASDAIFEVLHPGTGYALGLAGTDRSFLGLVTTRGYLAPELLFEGLHPGTGWKVGLAGSDRSFFGLIASDDTFAPERFRAPAGSITAPMLAPDIQTGLTPAPYAAFVQADGSGNGQIWAQRIADGSIMQVTTAGNNSNPRLDRSGKRVIYTSPTGDRVAQLDRDTGRGLSYPAVPGAGVTGIGDSYTDANTAGTVSYMTHLAALEPGWTLVNRGYGGDRCDHIGFRVGALQGFITLAGNQIPADTSPVAATIGTAAIRATDLTIIIRAPSGDVQGNLHFDGAAFTFARAAAGAVVPVPAGTEIVSAYADATRSTIRVIAGSVNDQAANRTTDEIVADLVAIMDDQRTILKKTIVMGCWDSRWFSAQQIANKAIINAKLQAAAAARGMCFLDTCSYVIAHALDIMAANSITPTATDTADLARGVVPYSLRADPALDASGTHVSTIVSEIWAEQVRDLILSKGYLS